MFLNPVFLNPLGACTSFLSSSLQYLKDKVVLKIGATYKLRILGSRIWDASGRMGTG